MPRPQNALLQVRGRSAELLIGSFSRFDRLGLSLECKAIGEFPNDPFVKQNSAVIAGAEQLHLESEQAGFRNLLLKVAVLRG